MHRKPSIKEAEPKGYWWCQHCVTDVDPHHVTNDEHHELCGAFVEWMDAPQKSTNEEELKLALRVKDIRIAELEKGYAAQVEINIQKPTADMGLVEELKRLLDNTKWYDSFPELIKNLISKYTPVKEQEPLAALAQRKGWVFDDVVISVWERASQGKKEKEFSARTYEEAESECREYLNGLGDK